MNARTGNRRRRIGRGTRLVVAIAVALSGSLLLAPMGAHASSSVTKSKTVTRYHLDADGKKTVVDQRTVKVTVDETTDLRSLQLVHVAWSGARPTAGVAVDVNSDLAQNEEYPMVLLECRGVDSTNVPPAQRISPQTCWTQYADERMYYGYNSYPAWRSDAEATKAERAAIVDAPKSTPDGCKGVLVGTVNQRWVPFRSATGEVFDGGPFGCAGLAPEAAPANLSSLSLPSNETFGVTRGDGTGQADFDIFTGEDHASLGCSQTVACSLVAIPIMGISCDPAGTLLPAAARPSAGDLPDATSACEDNGRFTPGVVLPPGKSGADAVDGRLWWSASNWNNRITIPLSFAPPDNACQLVSAANPVQIYGSELLSQATTQWAPTFCLNSKLFNFDHVQTAEPQAANLLNTGNIGAAFVSQPPDGGFTNPTVMAPTAVTGFGVAFSVDDVDQHTVQHLNLDARLLAKLLTQSYPDIPTIRDTHYTHVNKDGTPIYDMQNNPLNITFDPEFQALNPGIPARQRDSAAALLSLSSQSDVIYALTSYIEADPEARAFLDGAPDPWGMTVNPLYKGMDLPVDTWPLRDGFEPSIPANDCYTRNPAPYLPLVAAPLARLFTIGQDLQFAISPSQTGCSFDPNNPIGSAKLVADGREQVGSRFMLGLVSLGDAAREGLRLASLETQKSDSAEDQFTGTTGRTFVAPTPASLRAAAGMLAPAVNAKMWTLPYHALRKDPAGADAYPGTMVVYTAVPTKGLSASDAHDFATFIRMAVTDLQQPGTGQGLLPAGFLPMTAANNLGALATYAQVAANAVAAQDGTVPDLDAVLPPPPTPPPSQTGTPSTTETVLSSPVSVPPSGGAPSQAVPPVAAATSKPSSAPSSAPPSSPESTPRTSAAAQIMPPTPGLGTGGAALIVPLLAALVIAAGAAAFVVRLRGRGGHA